MKTIWLECFSCILKGLQQILAWITYFVHVQNIIFFGHCHEKRVITLMKCLLLDSSDTQTKSMRVSESEAWLPKIIILLINLFCNIVFRQLTSKRLQHDGKPKIPKDEGLYLFKREPVYGRSKIDFTHLLKLIVRSKDHETVLDLSQNMLIC